jgi:hypothetical protein
MSQNELSIPSVARDLLLRFTYAIRKVVHSRSPYNIVQRLIYDHFMAQGINKTVRLDAITKYTNGT